MAHLLKPWTWFSSKNQQPAERYEVDRHNARRAIAGVPRKRKAEEEEDPLDIGRKRLKASQGSAPETTTTSGRNNKNSRQTSPQGHYWQSFGLQLWRNETGIWKRGTNSSVEHANAIADFDIQTQLYRDAVADPSAAESVVIQSNQSPHTNDRGPEFSVRPLTSMPPPPKPPMRNIISQKRRRSSVANDELGNDVDSRSNASVAPSTASKRGLPQPDAFDLERARRHAAAVALPNNSGVWALSEKQLFYHLALRGFEPLIPENWMVDFKTLPLSLFANENTDPPLIQALHGSEFRAIRALHDLMETGKVVREKSISSPGSHVAKKMEKVVKDYFAWALADGDFDTLHDKYIPTYHITTRKQGQTTADAIATLNARLRKLAARHHERLGILSSIEPGAASTLPTDLQNSATQIFDDSAVKEPPVMVGVLVVSKFLVIFTLNGYNSLGGDPSDDIDNSGLRYVAKFDFSDAAYDVWHAFAVAITAVHVRDGMQRRGFDKIDHSKIKKEQGVSSEELEDFNISPGRMMEPRTTRRGKGKGKQAVNDGWFDSEGFEDHTTMITDDDPDR